MAEGRLVSDDAKGSIFCPKCAIPTQVIDTRGAPDNTVRRRRRCSDCNGRFTTYEEIYMCTESNRERTNHARKLIGQLADMLGVGRDNEH